MDKAMANAAATATPSLSEPALVQMNRFILENQTLILILAGLALVGIMVVGFLWNRKSGKAAPTSAKAPDSSVISTPSQSKDHAEGVPSAPSLPSEIAEIKAIDRGSWLTRLKDGLSKTRTQLVDNLGSLLTGKLRLDDELLEEIHEILFRADLGIETADSLIAHLRTELGKNSDKDINIDLVRNHLRAKIREILQSAEAPFNAAAHKPQVILIIGVNGVGKTTSIGKLAAHFMANDKNVLLGAADTFRAAAIDQLSVWADRIGCDVVKHQAGSDPASVAFDTVKAAMARNTDIVLIDTAGRLHNKRELMDELSKIRRVVSRDISDAPHETWLVIDATTGQNAIQQIKAFTEVAPLSGLIITKLDGTAKGGVVISAAEKFKLPIRFIGVGEKAADLRPFKAEDFAESIV